MAHWITTVALWGICQESVAHVNFSHRLEKLSVSFWCPTRSSMARPESQKYPGSPVHVIAGTCRCPASHAFQGQNRFCVCTEGRATDLMWSRIWAAATRQALLGSELFLPFRSMWDLWLFFVNPELLWKSLPDFLAVNKKYGATETKISCKLARPLSSWWFFVNHGVCRYLVACVCLDSKSVQVRRWVGMDCACAMVVAEREGWGKKNGPGRKGFGCALAGFKFSSCLIMYEVKGKKFANAPALRELYQIGISLCELLKTNSFLVNFTKFNFILACVTAIATRDLVEKDGRL